MFVKNELFIHPGLLMARSIDFYRGYIKRRKLEKIVHFYFKRGRGVSYTQGEGYL